MSAKSKAYAASKVLEILTPNVPGYREVVKYRDKLGQGTVLSPTDNPQEELVGLDEVLICLGKANPRPGKASSIRTEILSRLDTRKDTPKKPIVASCNDERQ